MIVGTAGHIDHGKTTLVRAFNGVDTDRLPEEKKRGIRIELGYAFLDVPGGGRIGFIDVPGHERLVHTMLAGATGIDFALLLVAADDGVMPQTREHLAVLALLGVARGALVVTKTDRADPARVQSAAADATALLHGTPLEGAPVFAVSAAGGDGVAALREHLIGQARRAAAETGAIAGDAAFRVAIDRAFALDGVGTVVTGTVHAGEVAVGDTLRLVPGERAARVRSLHAQNQAVERARAGERCAIALAGIDRQHIERGQWLVAPAAALATQRLDASVTLWAGEDKPLRSGTPVHVHIGAATTMGTVAVLDQVALVPGESGRVQLVLHAPVGAWHGDPVVLRDAAASRTLAGGRVLDPFAPVRYRRTPQRFAELDALGRPTAAERLAALLAAAPTGVDLVRFAAAQGCPVPVLPAGTLRQTDARQDGALGAVQAAEARTQVLRALATFHEKHPDELGPDAARLRRLALPRLPEPLWRALLATMQGEGCIARRGAFVHQPEHGVRLSATEQRIAQKVAPLLASTGFDGVWVRDLARGAGEPEPMLRVTLARLAQRGELHQVVKDLYLPPATMSRPGFKPGGWRHAPLGGFDSHSPPPSSVWAIGMVNVRGCEFPDGLYYHAEDQVWARLEADGTATVGITSLGIRLAGEIYMCRPKSVGSIVTQGRSVAVVELAKSIVSVRTPVGGTVVQVNERLGAEPELVHLEPYAAGWIARIALTDFAADAQGLVQGDAVAAAMEHHAALHKLD